MPCWRPSPPLYRYERSVLGITAERVQAEVCRLARGLLATG